MKNRTPKYVALILILVIFFSMVYPVQTFAICRTASISEPNSIPDQLILNQANDTSFITSGLPIPLGLLQNWLQISPTIIKDDPEILIFGNLLPINYTMGHNYGGRLKSSDLIGSQANDSTYSEDSLEVIELLKFLLDDEPINFWPNLRVHYVSIDFEMLTDDKLYEEEFVSFFEYNLTITNFAAAIVLEAYFGTPFDTFNSMLLQLNQNDVPIFARAIVGQPYGDLLSPGNNPGVIAIATLELENNDFSEFIEYNQFRLKYQYPIIQNTLYKTSPDFLIPGEYILVSNSSEVLLSPVYREYKSERLPLVLFALFYLTYKFSIPPTSSIDTNREALELLTQTSVYLNEPTIQGAQNGFGIPQFDYLREKVQVIKPFEMNAFDKNENGPEMITTGQELYTVIEVVPSISNITLNQLNVTSGGSTEIIKMHTELRSLNITNELELNNPSSVWRTSKLIPFPLRFGNISDDQIITVGIEFIIEGETMTILKEFKVDNNRNLLGIPLFLERDGYYKSDLPFNRFQNAFSGLDSQGWSISLFSEFISLETEVSKLAHDVVILLDPDIYPHSLESLLDGYVDKGGNVMYFLDDDSALNMDEDLGHGLTSYFTVNQNLTSWIQRQGIDLISFNSDNDPTLIKVLESGSPFTQSAFYLTPFISSSSVFHSIPLYPFRGFSLEVSSRYAINLITEFRNTTKIGIIMKNNEGLNSIIGTTSVFVDDFYGFPINYELPNQAEILNGLLLMGSGATANLTVQTIKDPSIFRNRIQIEVSSNRVYPNLQNSRWQYRITGPEIGEKTFDIDTKLLKIFPSFFKYGNSNLSVQILLNERIIDEVMVTISLQTSIMNKILVYLIWITLVSTSIVLYKRDRKLKDLNYR